jgi:hypothetical protein
MIFAQSYSVIIMIINANVLTISSCFLRLLLYSLLLPMVISHCRPLKTRASIYLPYKIKKIKNKF